MVSTRVQSCRNRLACMLQAVRIVCRGDAPGGGRKLHRCPAWLRVVQPGAVHPALTGWFARAMRPSMRGGLIWYHVADRSGGRPVLNTLAHALFCGFPSCCHPVILGPTDLRAAAGDCSAQRRLFFREKHQPHHRHRLGWSPGTGNDISLPILFVAVWGGG